MCVGLLDNIYTIICK